MIYNFGFFQTFFEIFVYKTKFIKKIQAQKENRKTAIWKKIGEV